MSSVSSGGGGPSPLNFNDILPPPTVKGHDVVKLHNQTGGDVHGTGWSVKDTMGASVKGDKSDLKEVAKTLIALMEASSSILTVLDEQPGSPNPPPMLFISLKQVKEDMNSGKVMGLSSGDLEAIQNEGPEAETSSGKTQEFKDSFNKLFNQLINQKNLSSTQKDQLTRLKEQFLNDPQTPALKGHESAKTFLEKIAGQVNQESGLTKTTEDKKKAADDLSQAKFQDSTKQSTTLFQNKSAQNGQNSQDYHYQEPDQDPNSSHAYDASAGPGLEASEYQDQQTLDLANSLEGTRGMQVAINSGNQQINANNNKIDDLLAANRASASASSVDQPNANPFLAGTSLLVYKLVFMAMAKMLMENSVIQTQIMVSAANMMMSLANDSAAATMAAAENQKKQLICDAVMAGVSLACTVASLVVEGMSMAKSGLKANVGESDAPVGAMSEMEEMPSPAGKRAYMEAHPGEPEPAGEINSKGHDAQQVRANNREIAANNQTIRDNNTKIKDHETKAAAKDADIQQAQDQNASDKVGFASKKAFNKANMEKSAELNQSKLAQADNKDALASNSKLAKGGNANVTAADQAGPATDAERATITAANKNIKIENEDISVRNKDIGSKNTQIRSDNEARTNETHASQQRLKMMASFLHGAGQSSTSLVSNAYKASMVEQKAYLDSRATILDTLKQMFGQMQSTASTALDSDHQLIAQMMQTYTQMTEKIMDAVNALLRK